MSSGGRDVVSFCTFSFTDQLIGLFLCHLLVLHYQRNAVRLQQLVRLVVGTLSFSVICIDVCFPRAASIRMQILGAQARGTEAYFSVRRSPAGRSATPKMRLRRRHPSFPIRSLVTV